VLNRKKWKVLQVYVPKDEARKFTHHAEPHRQSLSGMIRRLVNFAIDATTTN